ncbi:MAG: hypothetical protein FJ220_04155 [Kiritimatiellaceae bacterium]|nr:hypothetical protein [Kiritimatiellaceae bacterium]
MAAQERTESHDHPQMEQMTAERMLLLSDLFRGHGSHTLARSWFATKDRKENKAGLYGCVIFVLSRGHGFADTYQVINRFLLGFYRFYTVI